MLFWQPTIHFPWKTMLMLIFFDIYTYTVCRKYDWSSTRGLTQILRHSINPLALSQWVCAQWQWNMNQHRQLRICKIKYFWISMYWMSDIRMRCCNERKMWNMEGRQAVEDMMHWPLSAGARQSNKKIHKCSRAEKWNMVNTTWEGFIWNEIKTIGED